MQSFWLIFQLLFCLYLGYAFAARFPRWLQQLMLKLLPYFSYILLIAISLEFAQTLNQIPQPERILTSAMLISFSTSLGAFSCCYGLFKWAGFQPSQGRVSFSLVLQSLLNISYAFIALAAGYLLYLGSEYWQFNLHISTWHLLLVFMLMIGFDLARAPLDRSWLNWNILLVPVGCIVGSILGALFCLFWLSHISLKDLIMLSQGYGFYSMSGIVISELRTTELGSIALMNDLFREIFAIVLMYLMGWRYPRAAISSAGATAMDVTLPMVKQACGNDFIPHAMVSGFVLSVLAPIVVSILAVI
ncbi:lysine exporter LysO family protein [Acinetobacter indicus]|uniref:lysine exporter LysO family protein n=1 Tax=Acinetobacter indicus TaxID=756892 RepID=UPI0032B61F28